MTNTHTTAHIPNEAVQAAKKAVSERCKKTYLTNDQMYAALSAALPHLSAPCAVEAAVLDDESLRAQISEIGNQIHNLSCEYQNNEPLSERLRDIRGKLWDISKRTAKPVDVAAVRRQAFEEGFENGVEQSLNALDAYDDITRNEAEQGIRKLKPDYRALSAEPALGDQWQPIETAPKDETWIIAIRPKCTFGRWDRVVIVCWSDDFKKWIWPDSQFDVYADDINETDDEGLYTYGPFQSDQFTHWMSLPAAPTTEAGRAALAQGGGSE